MVAGNPLGIFKLGCGGCRKLATFFKEMIIRVIIIGMSLMRSKPMSYGPSMCEQAAYTEFPLQAVKKLVWLTVPLTHTRITYTGDRARNIG